METPTKRRRTPMLVVLAFNAALLMSPIAALLSVTTYVPRAEAEGLLMAATLAVASLVLVALCWRRLPRMIRVLAAGIVLMSGLALWMLGYRCVW